MFNYLGKSSNYFKLPKISPQLPLNKEIIQNLALYQCYNVKLEL